MLCEDASEIDEAIWTALCRVDAGEFLLDLLPEQFTRNLADYPPDTQIVDESRCVHGFVGDD